MASKLVVGSIIVGTAIVAGSAGYVLSSTQQAKSPAVADVQIKQEPAAQLAPTAPSNAVALSDLFGIASPDGKIMLTPSSRAEVWFAQSFSSGEEKIHVVFTKQVSVKKDGQIAEDSHASAPSIGAITYKLIDKQWLPVAKQKTFTTFGAWGETPDIKEADVLPLGGTSSLLIESASFGQGYLYEGKTIFALEKTGWRDLGFVQTGGNNSGNCSDDPKDQQDGLSPCYSYSGKISVGQNEPNGQYPNLTISHTGTNRDANRKIVQATGESVKFNGKDYVQF